MLGHSGGLLSNRIRLPIEYWIRFPLGSKFLARTEATTLMQYEELPCSTFASQACSGRPTVSAGIAVQVPPHSAHNVS